MQVGLHCKKKKIRCLSNLSDDAQFLGVGNGKALFLKDGLTNSFLTASLNI